MIIILTICNWSSVGNEKIVKMTNQFMLKLLLNWGSSLKCIAKRIGGMNTEQFPDPEKVFPQNMEGQNH